jgi:subtilisin family serine protease
MSVGNIQTTQYGNAVAMNAAKAAGSEGGQSIEAQVMSLMALGYQTNVNIMKQKVQEYRAQLKLQQQYNDALAYIEKYNAGFSGTDAASKRTEDATVSKGGQKALEANGGGAPNTNPTGGYEAAAASTKGITDAQRKDLTERGKIADMAKSLGLSEDGENNDLNAFFKGDATKGFVDGLKTKIKGAMDAIGADLQLAMIDIQTIKGRIDQYMTAQTTFVKSTGDTAQSIARNL